MNSEELLMARVRRYLMLSVELGPDAESVNEEYRKLKDLLIVEIYFMKTVRNIVSDEEMSGFVLYVEKDLRLMIDSFNPSRSRILSFLRHNIELRAMSYLSVIRRSRCFNSRFSNRLLTLGEDVEQEGPEDLVLLKMEEEDAERKTQNTIDRLRYLCALWPAKQKNLFIFLCTLLPCSSTEMIDNFCSLLNIDKQQTFAIADFLSELKGPFNQYRTSREYRSSRRNFFLMRRIELESHLRNALDEQKLIGKLEYQKKHLKSVHMELEHTRMNVRYRILSEILGVRRETIASAVYRSKRLLEYVSGKEIRMRHDGSEFPELRSFEPFREFNITVIPRPGTKEELFLTDIGIA